MDIQPLITPWTSLELFTNATNRNLQYCPLPGRFAYPLRQTGSLKWACPSLIETSSDAYEYRRDMEFKQSIDTGTYFKTLAIFYVGIELFRMTDYFPNGFKTLEEKYRLINLILEIMNFDGSKGIKSKLGFYYQIYWESYKGEYIKDKFIFITYDASSEGKSIGLNETVGPTGDTGTITKNTFSKSITTSTTTIRSSPVRIYESENIAWSSVHPYSKTNFQSPLAYIEEDVIYIFRNNEFIVESIKLNYIRRPRRVDLDLERSCELSQEAQKEIVNMAVTNCLERVEAGRYKTSLTENKFNE